MNEFIEAIAPIFFALLVSIAALGFDQAVSGNALGAAAMIICIAVAGFVIGWKIGGDAHGK